MSSMNVNEIIVKADQTPGKVSFYNFEELKEYMRNGLSVYETTSYTPENLNVAEATEKSLRLLRKS